MGFHAFREIAYIKINLKGENGFIYKCTIILFTHASLHFSMGKKNQASLHFSRKKKLV